MGDGDQVQSGADVQTACDYEVGYRKPPKHTQWQPGQSGNPRGGRKRKLTSNLAEAAREALSEVVCVPIRGKLRRMTLAQATMYKAAVAAGGGDAQARRDLMKLQQSQDVNRGEGGWTIVQATLTFDNEENRLAQLAEENRLLREQLNEMQEALNKRVIELKIEE